MTLNGGMPLLMNGTNSDTMNVQVSGGAANITVSSVPLNQTNQFIMNSSGNMTVPGKLNGKFEQIVFNNGGTNAYYSMTTYPVQTIHSTNALGTVSVIGNGVTNAAVPGDAWIEVYYDGATYYIKQ